MAQKPAGIHMELNYVIGILCKNVLSCSDVFPVVENGQKYTSMRVCVYSMDIKKLYDGNLWPMGVVRPWKFKYRS